MNRCLAKKIPLLIFFIFIQASVFSQSTLFSFGSNWKYKDDGSDQGTAWSQVGFDDSSWASGLGQFGYGADGETTILNACGVPVQNPLCATKYIGYYFRKTINIPDVSIYKSFTFEMYRDDGAIVYVNGTEVYRNNMPAGTINYNTLATVAADDDGNLIIKVTLTLALSQIQSGDNLIAVEVHQNAASSSDLTWDMKLTGIPVGLALITRGPYLQKATPTSMLVRWYTDDPEDSEVKYGTDPGNLSQSVVVPGLTNSHSVPLTGLTPYTKYYYSVGNSTAILQSGLENYFLTSPLPNAEGKYTFWAMGDMGDNSARQRNVRDQFISYIGNNITNGWLLLGDNAYDNGTDEVYTAKFFEIYQANIMRKSPLWPATGNHEYANTLARQIDHNIPYFGIFDLPTNGEAGGVPSNSEAYYSYDYGNIHFIALDSYIIENGTSRLFDISGPQVQWLEQDLAANDKKWTIVYFHHPPFTKGSHNSDTESELRSIRENVVPILEQYDVDLVLTGHSHDYERSKLMKGHFGLESTFDPAVHHLSQSSGKYDGTANSCIYTKDSPDLLGGTVYAVVGSSGRLDPGQPDFPHNAMYYGNQTNGGSLILEIEENRLDGKWLSDDGVIRDNFTIMKRVNKVNNINLISGESLELQASWVGQYDWDHSVEATRTVTVAPTSSTTYTVIDNIDPNKCITDTYNVNVVIATLTIDIPTVGFTQVCAGSTVSISYTTTGVFSAGNTFTLQLSNAAGSFTSPINIGTLSSTTSGTINGVIPGNTPGGGNYQFRIVSNNPVFTGSESSAFTVSAPTAPTVGTITQPTCALATGSVVLSGLPSSGTWTLTRSPGSITSTGTGTSTTITGLSSATYTYTVTNASGCISSSSSNVVINAQPVTPVAPTVGTITQPTCALATGSVVLSGLPSSGTWTLTRSPGSITSTGTGTSTTITGLSSATYTYTVTNASGCISSSSSNVVINAQPVTPAAPTVGTITQPTCALATGSVVLSGLPSSGTWTLTRSPGSITSTGTGTSTTITGLSSATYTYTVTNASGCISSSSSNVVINAQPVTPAAPTVGTITQPTCALATGSVVLSGLPSSGTWTLTRSPGSITSTGTGTSTTITGLSSATYTYTVTNASGCISSSSSNVVINAQPVTPVAPTVGTITQPTCALATGSVVLSGLPSSGTWTLTRSPGSITSTGTGTSTTITGLSSGTYTYTVTNASGCISSSSSNVVINAQPVTPAAPTVGTITQPTCALATGSVVLSGLPSSGTWTLTRSPGSITSTGTGASTTITGLSSGTYTYTVTNASGCISSSSSNVVINAQPVTPAAPTVGTITQPTCALATGSVVLSGLPSSGTWTLTRSPGSITSTGTGTSTTITGLSSATYTYTVTNASGCISSSSSNVVINAQPVTPVAPTVGTITQPTCALATGSVVLSGLPSSGTWTLTRSPGSITSTGTGASTTITGLSSGTYTYTVTNASGCISSSSSNVVINASLTSPTTPTVGSITQPTCALATGSVVLSGLPSSGTWTLTRSPGSITSTGTGTSTTITGLSSGTYTYTVTNTSGCVSSSSSNVVINAQPVTPAAPTVGTITQPTCALATGSVVLSGLPSSGTWTLTRSPGSITSTGTGTSTTITGLSSGTYTYTVTNASGCVSSSSSNVVINASLSSPTTPTVGTITQPTCALATGSVVLSGLPSSGTWTLTRSPGGITSTGTGTSTTITGLSSGTYTYTVTNASGCVSSSSSNVVINAQPVTPNAPTAAVTEQPTCSVAAGTITVTVPTPGGPGVSFTVIGTTPVVAAQSNSTGIFSGLAAGDYDVTATVNGCTSNATTLTVIAELTTPAPPTVSDVEYCQNATATALTAIALSGHTLLWYGTNATGGASSTLAPIPSTSTAGTISYYVSQRNNTTNCESVRSSIIVTIKSTPKPIITATGVGTENVLLTSSASVGNQWFKDGVAITGATSQTYSVLSNAMYQVRATANGCVSELSEPFTVMITAVGDSKEPITLKLFPVPAQQVVNIQLTGVKEDEVSEVMIFDMSGRVVDKQRMRGKESILVIEEYTAGEYFLRINGKSFLLNSRFVKY